MVRPLVGCKSPSPGLCGPPQTTAFALQVIPTRAEPRHQGGLHPQSPKISFGTTSCLRVNFWGDPSACAKVSIIPAMSSSPGFILTGGNACGSKKSISLSSRRGSGELSKNEIFPVWAGWMDGKTQSWQRHGEGEMGAWRTAQAVGAAPAQIHVALGK